jgi:hypothetical protein
MSAMHLARALALLPALTAVVFSDVLAQACIGIPIRDGQMAVQGEATGRSREAGLDLGGRVGVNFNTPFSLDFAVSRPDYDAGRGTVIATRLAFEILDYQPSVCPYAGFEYQSRPGPNGEADTRVLLPVGIGFGRTVGSARMLSLSLFATPELVFLPGEDATDPAGFFDEIRARSMGRGTLGLVMGTPFLYGVAGVQLTTVAADDPVFSLGIGMIF